MNLLYRLLGIYVISLGLSAISPTTIIAQSWSGEGLTIIKSGTYYQLKNNGRKFQEAGTGIYMAPQSQDQFFFSTEEQLEIIFLPNGSFANKKVLTYSEQEPETQEPRPAPSPSPPNVQGNTNALDANAQTNLHQVVRSGTSKQLESLLDSGAKIDQLNSKQQSALDLAVSNRKTEMVRILVERGAMSDNLSKHPAFVKAIRSRNTDLVQAFLDGGYSIEGNPHYLKEALKERGLALINENMIRVLAENNVDVSIGLERAVQEGNYSTFDILMRSNSGTQLSKDNFIKGFSTFPEIWHELYVKLALRKMNKNVVLAGVMEMKSLPWTELVLKEGGDVRQALNYGLKTNNYPLVKTCLANHKGKPDLPMKAAINENNPTISRQWAKLAMEHGASPNSYIVPAVQQCNPDVLAFLLENGGDANLGMIPAIEKQQSKCFEKLLSAGPKLNDPKYLLKIVEVGSNKMAQMLLDKQTGQMRVAHIKVAMLPAIEKDQVSMVRLFIDSYGVRPSDPKYLQSSTKLGKMEMTKLLLEKGAKAQDGLLHAIRGNHLHLTQLLLSKGANGSDNSYMREAVLTDNKHMVKLMIDQKADPEFGLSVATYKGLVNSTKTLLENRPDAPAQKYLVQSVKNSYPEIVGMLLQKGTNPNYKEVSTGHTLLHIACKNNSAAIAKTLVNAGNDPNAKDLKGNSPLHLAVPKGRSAAKLVEILIEKGANVKAKNNSGKSVLAVAKGRKIRGILKKNGAE